MKEWVLANTTVTEYEYDKLINPNTTYIEGETITKPVDNDIFDHPLVAIHKFTYHKPNFIRNYYFQISQKNDIFTHKQIEFKILAENLKNIIDKSSTIDTKQLSLILYSHQRNHQCFTLSINICLIIENSRIVTAVCTDPYYQKEQRFLHTFVIITKNNTEYVLDSTFNIIMKKDTYLQLFKANIVSDISKEKLKSFLKYINENCIGSQIRFEEYYCFPEQITEGAKKYVREKNK